MAEAGSSATKAGLRSCQSSREGDGLGLHDAWITVLLILQYTIMWVSATLCVLLFHAQLIHYLYTAFAVFMWVT